MKKGNDFGFDIQAKSNNDLLNKLRIKVENQGNNNVGNIRKKEHRKPSLNNIAASQQMKNVEANKPFKKPVQPKKGFVKNYNIRSQMEVEASTEIPAPIKVFVQNNNIKNKSRSTEDYQVKGSTESQVSKNNVDQNQEVRKNNNLKRQVRSPMGNEVQGSTVDQQPSKKKKPVPKCPAMPINEYLNKNKEQDGVDDEDDEDIEGNEVEEDMEMDINYEGEEIEGTGDEKAKGLKRKRGKTLCRSIHARQFKDREEITLNGEGQPIGPDGKTVSQFSSFLGTIGKSSDLCPLTFTSWIGLVKSWEKQDIDPVWDYVNEKYIVPNEGRKAVLAIVNDAWKRYKCFLKREHFTPYKTMRERLKNRPEEVPEEDFKSLLEYWRDEKTQEVSHQNAQNIAQLKFRHRTGNKSFAVVRENMRLSSEDKEPPNQAQVFIATRQSKKGKELDKETNNAIIKLQDMIEKHKQPSSEAFQKIKRKSSPLRKREL
ncbi:hypothetical protein P8452_65831 [Trifolium repens]|nr:hypothetical protein P8452_65831 [Trifolium repens]